MNVIVKQENEHLLMPFLYETGIKHFLFQLTQV